MPKKTEIPPLRIRAVLFEEEGWWVAQCLEYNVATQAKSLEDLRYELERILLGHLVVSAENATEPFQNLPPAPQRFWRMYESAQPIEPPADSSFHAPEGLSGVKAPAVELRAAA